MRLGIFGGTFDPPHLGHLILAAEAIYQAELDRLLFVLTAEPPHKGDQPITPIEHRLDMLQAAIEEDLAFELSRLEIDRAGPHYAADTLKLLQEAKPDAELIYLMGGDSLRELPTWHRSQEFVAACHGLAVMRRPDDQIDLAQLEAEFPGIRSKLQFIDAPLLQIASRQIRRRIAEKRPFRYYLPPAVYQMILERKLYSAEGGEAKT